MLLRYQKVSEMIRRRIEIGSLQPDERLPSVRAMSRQTGYSIETVCRAYADLEAAGMIRSRPRSGYYVEQSVMKPAEFADTIYAFPRDTPVDGEIYEQAYKLAAEPKRAGVVTFASLLPSPDLFYTINSELVVDVRRHLLRFASNRHSSTPKDDIGLEEALSRLLAQRNIAVARDDIVLTRGGLDNVAACLHVVTEPGDTVVIESPSFFPQFEILSNRNLKIVEIYSHPFSGIDPVQFEHLLRTESIKAVVLMPVHHFPTGVSYRFPSFQKVAEIAVRYQVPIIENDMFSGLTHRVGPTPALKMYDQHENILFCGTMSNYVGPGWDMGWIVSKRFREKLSSSQFFGSIDRANLSIQHAMAEYILRPRSQRRILQVGQKLDQRMEYGMKLIEKHFPHSCAVSKPTGGFMCWIRAPMSFDAVRASMSLYRQNIQVLAGPMFAMTPSFRNFIGLNLSYPWDTEREEALATIGSALST